MHGAGLSHVMFLPRQVSKVALVEVYNTMDDYCFQVGRVCLCSVRFMPLTYYTNLVIYRIWPS